MNNPSFTFLESAYGDVCAIAGLPVTRDYSDINGEQFAYSVDGSELEEFMTVTGADSTRCLAVDCYAIPTNELLLHLAQLPNLTALHLAPVDCIDINAVLAILPNLRALCIRAEDGLSPLIGRHHNLQALVLEGVDEATLAGCSFPQLQGLALHTLEDDISLQNIVTSLHPMNLRHLSLCDLTLSLDSGQAFDLPSTITSLSLIGEVDTDSFQHVIRDVHNQLTFLGIHANRFLHYLPVTNEQLPALTHLHLSADQQHFAQLRRALQESELPHLHTLDLRNAEIDDARLTQLLDLALLKQVKNVVLDHNYLSDKQLHPRLVALDAAVSVQHQLDESDYIF